jgi:hypothetical protein
LLETGSLCIDGNACPVIILRLTASLDSDAMPLFCIDIYDPDKRLPEAIDGPVIIELPAMPE